VTSFTKDQSFMMYSRRLRRKRLYDQLFEIVNNSNMASKDLLFALNMVKHKVHEQEKNKKT